MMQSNSAKHLLIINNHQDEYIIYLESKTYSIGRALNNLIVLDSPKISRYHATLLRITIPENDDYRFRIIDGDLNRRRSRNGIKINGNPCFSHNLQNNDVISFSDNLTATYKTIDTLKSVEKSPFFFLPDDEDLEATANFNESSNPQSNFLEPTLYETSQQWDASIQRHLERLASFPELFSDPIIEIDLQGNITYTNPAALKQFPTIKQEKLEHPLLLNIVALTKITEKKTFTREVKIGRKIYEQSIHLISPSRLIRCYVSDISKRKKAEFLLAKAHKELEQRVVERTSELVHNNELLSSEIGERRQKEQEISLLQTITQAISEAPSFDDAVTIILRKVCETVNWSFGEAWIPDFQNSVLQLSPAWFHSTEKLEYFREVSQTLAFPLNVGQPGRVWATKKPEWVENISIQNQEVFSRYKIAKATGLKTALAVPMIANEKIIAILVFYDFLVHPRNEQMLDLVKSVATQLGLIIERKKAEDALRSSMATNKAILEAIPDLILRVNRKGILVNYKAAKFDSSLVFKNEFLGKHLDEVFPQEVSLSIINCINEAFRTSEVQILECQIHNHDNKTNSYEIRIAISEMDEVMAIIRDITERKQAEEDTCKALEQQQKLNEFKSQFITMASHEFRTPLASILSSSELLEHYGHKWDEPKKLSHLYRIQDSVKHMTELLNDVLLLGKVDAGKIDLKPTKVDLSQLCQQLIQEFELNISTHKIYFKLEKQLNFDKQCFTNTVYIDVTIVKHIIYNLLSNAAKYSPDSDRIDFELIYQPQQAIIRVKDFGIGISETDIKHLFESFYRASNVNSIPGTGLGLHIVEKSVHLHGGEISVQSKIDFGSTFTVMLPYLNSEQ
ncbi:GAF domain-containing protein [Waterburya agarophytonicola K14]|uniref:histidine kinase n=1 Tax=Waterburya agarophytonicola KI4 TaxID=2874699 RepID=A0A964BS80_9CYAN|nr:ATP-binding protein [Waterburya agarophytonicola]MCC0178500.1 GAF domain-containing protein [Waterburya agarophytonicola KI4]